MATTLADGFIEAILEEPDEDTHRLVYADWLEEQNDDRLSARAAFIRTQVELASENLDEERRAFLREREKQLQRHYGASWAPALGRGASYQFHRGFVERVHLPAATLLKRANTLFQSTPVRHLTLQVTRRQFDGLTGLHQLERINSLDLSCSQSAMAELTRFLNSPYLAGLQNLRLRCPGAVEAVVAARHLHHLTRLDLGGGASLDDDSLNLLRNVELPKLRSLSLSCIGLGNASIRQLARFPIMPQLTELDLSYNQIGPSGMEALVTCCTHLETLRLGFNVLGDSGVQHLACSSQLAGLKRLFLARNRIESPGIEAIAHSPYLNQLSTLDLDYNNISPLAFQTLAESTRLPGLRQLYVRCAQELPAETRAALITRYGAECCHF